MHTPRVMAVLPTPMTSRSGWVAHSPSMRPKASTFRLTATAARRTLSRSSRRRPSTSRFGRSARSASANCEPPRRSWACARSPSRLPGPAPGPGARTPVVVISPRTTPASSGRRRHVWPDGAYGHPDHIAISQFTTAAIVSAADPRNRIGLEALLPGWPARLGAYERPCNDWSRRLTASNGTRHRGRTGRLRPDRYAPSGRRSGGPSPATSAWPPTAARGLPPEHMKRLGHAVLLSRVQHRQRRADPRSGSTGRHQQVGRKEFRYGDRFLTARLPDGARTPGPSSNGRPSCYSHHHFSGGTVRPAVADWRAGGRASSRCAQSLGARSTATRRRRLCLQRGHKRSLRPPRLHRQLPYDQS